MYKIDEKRVLDEFFPGTDSLLYLEGARDG